MYVGYAIVRKTGARLNKDEDIVVCLPGTRIEHVTARIERANHGIWKCRVHIGPHKGEQCIWKALQR